MCVVFGPEVDIKLDHSFQLSQLCSSSVGLILQGLSKLDYIVLILGVSTEVPVTLTVIKYFS